MNRKLAIALALGIVLLVALFFLMDRESDNGGGETASTTESSVETDIPIDGVTDDTEAETTNAEEDTPAEVEEEEIDDPLLVGEVFGEGAGIAGAHVLLFPHSEIDGIVERLEPMVVTGGTIPDIPAVINAVKKELHRFRKTATVLKTNEEGKFRLNRGRTGAFFVLTYAEGWLFEFEDQVSLQEGRTQELLVGLDRGTQISGRVINEGGAGIGGIEVIAEYSPPGLGGAGKILRKALKYINGEFLKGPFSVKSRSDGSFTIDSLPAGVYDLVAKDPRGIEVYSPKVETGSSSAVILLGKGASISGVLIDTDGIPVSGVPMQLERQENIIDLPAMFAGMAGVANIFNQYLGDGPKRAESRPDGSFRFGPLGAGRYKLTISERGFLPLEREVTIDWNEEHDIGAVAVNRGLFIAGVVRSAAGDPLRGAEVMAFKEGGGFMNSGGQMADFFTGRVRVKSDRDGRFELGGLSEGKYSLAATLKAHGMDNKRSVVAGTEDVEFALEPGIFFTGKVVDVASEPIAGVRVSVGQNRAITDKEGRFEIDIVAGSNFGGGMGMMFMAGPMTRRPGGGAPDSVMLEAQRKGYLNAETELVLDQLPADFVVTMDAAPKIEGMVRTPDGEPAIGALVRLTPAMEDADDMPPFIDPAMIFFALTVTDAEGRFEFTDYNAPFDIDWEVIADHLTYSRGHSRPFRIDELGQADVETVDIQLAAAANIRGRVLSNGTPVKGASVRLSPQDDDPQAAMFMKMLGLPPAGSVVRTNLNGEFEHTRIEEGAYMLSAEMVGYVSGSEQAVTVVAGEDQTYDLHLDPGKTIVGRVVDTADQPLSGASVRLLQQTDDDEMFEAQRFFGGAYKTARTNAEGKYKFEGLEDGEFSLAVDLSGFSTAEMEGVYPGLPVAKIVMIPSGDCRVIVADASTGAPVMTFTAGLVPEGEPDEDDFMPWRNWGQEVNDTDGIFERAGLEPGIYSVNVTATGYLPVTAEVEIEPGGVTEVSVDLNRAGRIRGKVRDNKGGIVQGAQISLEPASKKSSDDTESMREVFTRAMMRGTVRTDANGEFTIDCGPEEGQTLKATHDDYLGASKENVSVQRGEEIVINLTMDRGLSVPVKILDSNREPISRWFYVQGVEGTSGWKNGITESNGTAVVSGLKPGKYRIRSGGRTASQAEEMFELTEGQDHAGVTLIVEPDEDE